MATQTAASAAYADVNTAMGLCNDGDTLAIPVGTAEWASTLTVTKAITIQGAGKAATILTPHDTTHQYITLAPGSYKAQRVNGIGFIGGGANSGTYGKIHIDGDSAYVLSQIRIDHCDFQDDNEAIWSDGWVEGLIDHNTFYNCNRTILITGDGDSAWGRTIAAGTSHALFIEDNSFIYDDGKTGYDQFIYNYQGARSVVRYNDFDQTSYSGSAVAYDSHGNQNYYSGTSDIRGQPICEVYNNTFRYQGTYQVMIIRGGSVLIYNNTFTYSDHSDSEIMLGEEEAWQTAFFSPLRSAWPAQDQINNCFIWNNTVNGSSITDIDLWVPASEATFIQKDRDYFMHAPQSSGGSESYTGARKGGSTTTPTETDTGNMEFNAGGANAYYPYTAYTYPHPMQGVNPWVMIYG